MFASYLYTSSYTMSCLISLLCVIRIDIYCVHVKGLVNKNHCHINSSNTNEDQLKGWAVLGT
jgi:hypothetical protein